MIFGKNEPLRNELETGGGGMTELPGGMSMDAAVAEMESGLDLGDFNADATPGNDTLDGDPGVHAPSPAPAAPAPSPAPAAPAPSPAPAPGPAPAAPSGNAPDLTKPPGTWSAPAQAIWATLPEAARQEVYKREQDMWRGLEGYKADASVGRSMKQVIAPAMQALAARGVSETDFVGAITNAHVVLGNQQIPINERMQFAANLLKGYGLDISKAGELPEPTFEDPQVKHLREQVALLENRLNGADSQRFEETRQEMAKDLEKFAADPAHPHFYEVADDIVLLLRGSGGKMPLKEAYEKAVYANPMTRQKEVERLATEQRTKAETEARERAAAARKAKAANVKSGQHQAGSTAPQGSIDDTLNETLAAIRGRESKG